VREIYHIYIENFFLLNMVFLLSAYEITSVYLRCTVTHLQILKGALLGAIGMCLILIIPIGGASRFFVGYLLLNVLLIKYIFGAGKSKNRNLAMVTMVVSMLLGGALMLLKKLIRADSTLIMLAGTLFITFFVCRLLKMQQKKEDTNLCRATLFLGEKQWEVQALMDTGNSLFEPISGKPVSLVESGIWGHLPEFSPNTYRVIPFHSVGKENGLLPGYIFDKLEIETIQSRRTIVNPIIGISNQPLSSNETYQMILHPKLFMEREELS